jgi:hypothetical protein
MADLLDMVAERNGWAREDCETLHKNAAAALASGDSDAVAAVLAQALCYVRDMVAYESRVSAALATIGEES